MAAGKVCTGFSKPYVALYSNTGTTITFSSGQVLARGVDVSIEVETGDDNDFYADNVIAESAGKRFSTGTVTLTVDGLKDTAEKLIMGLPTATSDWYNYGSDQSIPYVAIGFLARYMSGGVTSWTPIVLVKCKFNEINTTAATQEDEIDWQTQELSAQIYRSDNATTDWKWVGKTEYSTETLAETALATKLGITS